MTALRSIYARLGLDGLRRAASYLPTTRPAHQYEALDEKADQSPRTRSRWAQPLVLLVLICTGGLLLALPSGGLINFLFEPEYRILIVQQLITHVPDPESEFYERDKERLLQFEASIASHQRYAEVWGYGYTLEDRDWTEGTGQSSNMNKIYAWIVAMEQELEKRRGAEWLLHTDADTLIFDPRISLDYFLPPGPGLADPRKDGLALPPPLDPRPLMIGNQDANGWNSGVVFMRVCEETLAFLRRTMELEPELRAVRGSPPKDQHLLGWSLRLEEHADFAAAFYETPQKWVNSYQIYKDEGGQTADGIDWTPQLQVHLVNHGIWFERDWTEDVVKYASLLYQGALQMALDDGEIRKKDPTDVAKNRAIRKQFLQSPERQKSLYATRHWWAKAKAGIANISFPEFQ